MYMSVMYILILSQDSFITVLLYYVLLIYIIIHPPVNAYWITSSSTDNFNSFEYFEYTYTYLLKTVYCNKDVQLGVDSALLC